MEQNGIVQPASITKASFEHGIDAWSANSGLVYKAGLKDTIRLTYGRGIIMPSQLQSGSAVLRAAGPNTFIDVIGNPHLAPTIVQNIELGHDHRFTSLDSTLKTSVFYTHNHDIIGNAALGGVVSSAPYTYFLATNQNNGGSRALGAEIELQGQNARGFRWDASYSYVHVEDQKGVYNSITYSNSTPEHNVRLSLGYTTGPWEIDTHVQYLSQRSLLRAFTSSVKAPVHTGGYVTLGGRIAYTFAERYILAVSATELNEDDLQATSYPRIERQVLASLTSHF
jgi:outer membrane receptor protein involved in Fe transport